MVFANNRLIRILYNLVHRPELSLINTRHNLNQALVQSPPIKHPVPQPIITFLIAYRGEGKSIDPPHHLRKKCVKPCDACVRCEVQDTGPIWLRL